MLQVWRARSGEDLAAKESAAEEARRAASCARPLQPCRTLRMTPSGPEIAPAATFPPPLPSRLDRCPIRLAFLESQLRRCRWRCGRGRGAAFKRSLIQQKACRRSRSEEHTSELPSLIRISYAVFCLKKQTHICHL